MEVKWKRKKRIAQVLLHAVFSFRASRKMKAQRTCRRLNATRVEGISSGKQYLEAREQTQQALHTRNFRPVWNSIGFFIAHR